jgi:sulfite reductase (ferredoxin)
LHKKRLKIKKADAIYHAYAGFVNGAKAYCYQKRENKSSSGNHIYFHFLLKQIKSITIVKDLVFQINKEEPSEEFARKNTLKTIAFDTIEAFRLKI